MWLGFDELEGERNSIFLILGKALRLCQNYEMNFDSIMQIIQLEEGIKRGAIIRFRDEQWDATITKVSKWMLGTNVKELEKLGSISDRTIRKLTDGKEARNEIVHEGALMLRRSIRTGFLDENEGGYFRKAIESVAIADNVVAGWMWEVNEKERSFMSDGKYVERITNWIFSQNE
ncbi:MAG: hypothetical protein K8S54_03630 [Spirochaetia bacterium]|nr:hypothetical protein [Spirochaetia bacterium]